MTTAEFTAMTDLASRALSGSVSAAHDELAAETGGRLVGCSDAFVTSPANIFLPGRARRAWWDALPSGHQAQLRDQSPHTS